MTQELKGFQARVIKWDGDAPKEWVISRKWPFIHRRIPDPFGHPQCYEIVEFGDGRKPTVTYKRTD